MSPVPVVQMGHVEKIVEMQQNLPSVMQAAAGEATVRALDRSREKVSAGAETETSGRVRERDAGGGGGGERRDPGGEPGDRGAPESGGERKTGHLRSGRLLDITI
jgi:hypothetical protein